MCLFFRKCAILFWAYIQEHGPILRIDVDQVAQDIFRFFIAVINCVTPGVEAHGGITLPSVWLLRGQLSSLNIRNRNSKRIGIVFVIDHDLLSPLHSSVVIICSKHFQIRT